MNHHITNSMLDYTYSGGMKQNTLTLFFFNLHVYFQLRHLFDSYSHYVEINV